jgi:hypothetical protein
MVEEKVEHYSGVLCRCCRQPIALPEAVTKHRAEQDAEHDDLPRAFTLRCRACDKERPYGLADVTRFEGVPRIRETRAGLARWQRTGLARAANA